MYYCALKGFQDVDKLPGFQGVDNVSQEEYQVMDLRGHCHGKTIPNDREKAKYVPQLVTTSPETYISRVYGRCGNKPITSKLIKALGRFF